MSQYYNSQRTKGLYDPTSSEPFKLSRSKIDMFLNCPRCFYLDRRLGIGQPGGFPFTLNSAVDHLLKKEFDIHRAKNKAHPLMESYQIEAVPFAHEKMDQWRDNFKGIRVHHQPTNFLVFGAVDDIWAKPPLNLPLAKGENFPELMVVDYKATSVNEEITALDKEWHKGYKRQMEIYQWLMRQSEDFKDYQVSNTGYFVYANGKKDKEAFDSKLEFDVVVLAYQGDDSWVEQAIVDAHKCLNSDSIPKANPDCDFCAYREVVKKYD